MAATRKTASRLALALAALALAGVLAQSCAVTSPDGTPANSEQPVSKISKTKLITVEPSEDLLVSSGDVAITSDALREDLGIVAKDLGLTMAEAFRQQKKADLMGRLQGKIAKARSSQFVGGDIGRKPADVPTLYIKGEADEYILKAAKNSGMRIIIAEGQPYSMEEADVIQNRLTKALAKIGFRQFYTSYSVRRAKFEVDLEYHPDISLTAAEVRKRLPAVAPDRLDLKIWPDYIPKALRRAAKDPAKRPFGPMAVIDSSASFNGLVGGPNGTVRITKEGCVNLLYSDGKLTRKLLLAWRAAEVRWDGVSKAILFTQVGKGSKTRRIQNGDKINVGGSDISDREKVRWLVRPQKSCGGFVYEVEGVSDPRSMD